MAHLVFYRLYRAEYVICKGSFGFKTHFRSTSGELCLSWRQTKTRPDLISEVLNPETQAGKPGLTPSLLEEPVEELLEDQGWKEQLRQACGASGKRQPRGPKVCTCALGGGGRGRFFGRRGQQDGTRGRRHEPKCQAHGDHECLVCRSLVFSGHSCC